MSGVLHPVGPEPPATYWLRRALVLGVLAAVAALVISLVTALVPGRQQQRAVPAANASASPAPSPLADDATPSSRASAAASPSPSAAVPRVGPATAKRPTARSTAPKPAPNARRARRLADCAPSQLRITLTGKNQVQRREPATFNLSLINGSGARCLARVSGRNFKLKIYSGHDRIWSTDDCSTAVKPLKQKLASEQAVAWKLRWNGLRSAPDCETRPEIPGAGTYFVTAQLSGAKPVQLRMILRG